MPYTFTEQGVAMLCGILNSDRAIQMNIAIMRAFVEIRRNLLQQTDLKEQLKEIRERIGEHDVQLNQIYDAMENLLDENAAQRKWEERERIGLKKQNEIIHSDLFRGWKIGASKYPALQIYFKENSLPKNFIYPFFPLFDTICTF